MLKNNIKSFQNTFFTRYQRDLLFKSITLIQPLPHYYPNIDLFKLTIFFNSFITNFTYIYWIIRNYTYDFVDIVEKWFKIHGLRFSIIFVIILLIFGFNDILITIFILYMFYHIYDGFKMVISDYLRTGLNIIYIQTLILNCMICALKYLFI